MEPPWVKTEVGGALLKLGRPCDRVLPTWKSAWNIEVGEMWLLFCGVVFVEKDYSPKLWYMVCNDLGM